jgi:hypothetical protein
MLRDELLKRMPSAVAVEMRAESAMGFYERTWSERDVTALTDHLERLAKRLDD